MKRRFALILIACLSLMLMTSCSFFKKEEPAKEVPIDQTKPNAKNNTYNTYNTYYNGTSGSSSTSTGKKTTAKKYVAPKKKTVPKKSVDEYDADDWYFRSKQPVYIYVPVPLYTYTPPTYTPPSSKPYQSYHPYNTYDAVGAFNYAN